MPSPAVDLTALPAPWRADPLVCSRRGAQLRWHGDGSGLVTLAPTPAGLSVAGYGTGAPALVAELFAAGDLGGPLRGIDLPRELDLPEPVRVGLGLQRQPGWDWLWTETPPAAPCVEVVELDPATDAEAIRECLAEANPETWGDPGPDDAGWWGVADRTGRLAGVVGATEQGGRTANATSWHLGGLGVRPGDRGRGLGAALMAAATRAGLAAGADWVSLGVWAHNLTAIRLYHRLGYRTGHRRASWRPGPGCGAACNE